MPTPTRELMFTNKPGTRIPVKDGYDCWIVGLIGSHADPYKSMEWKTRAATRRADLAAIKAAGFKTSYTFRSERPARLMLARLRKALPALTFTCEGAYWL